MIYVYNLSIRIYQVLIQFAALFGNSKARLWLNGRQNVFDILQNKRIEKDKYIWFHAASLGEFEQGRPLIERIKAEYPHYKIALTFFSPSGYEIRKNYPIADLILYLPIDTKQNATKFLELLNPSLVVFIKYEFWYHYLNEAIKRNIPVIYIAARFDKNMIYFRPYFTLFIPILQKIYHFFVQNESSAKTLNLYVNKNKSQNITIAGDPRIDRVVGAAAETMSIPLINDFCNNSKILIAGSTWEKDIEILKELKMPKDWKMIIAPHEIAEKNLKTIEGYWGKTVCCRYSAPNASSKVLIIDNIGMLSSIYRYGTIAYIGGGFGAGIHNILEPMAFNLPVIFGPKYTKFEEANEMIRQNAAFSISSGDSLKETFSQLNKSEIYKNAAKKINEYMLDNQGATNKILDFCKLNLLH
ncbi:MAG: 3-deoxy-D-manno-octulosonic acid transferase [Saprospiraceae bacterium]